MSQLVGAPVRAAVHALGRARLGQLRPGADDGHPRRRRRERATSSRSSTRSFGIPYYTTDSPTEAAWSAVPTPVLAASRARRHDQLSGTQYNIPNRRVIGKTLPLQNNYFKTSSLRAPKAPQTTLRLRADDRRARATRRRWIRTSSGSRTSRRADQANGTRSLEPAGRTCSSSVGASSRTGSRRWRPRTCRTRQRRHRPRDRARRLRRLAGRRSSPTSR